MTKPTTNHERAGTHQPTAAHDAVNRLAGPRDAQIADLVAGGVLDAVAGDIPVPISVWRATDPDHPDAIDKPEDPNTTGTSGDLAGARAVGSARDGLTPRLMAILLSIYTDEGDLVLDALDDPVVRGTVGAAARRYLTCPAHAIGAAQDVALILLRWPTHDLPDPTPDLTTTTAILTETGSAKVTSDSTEISAGRTEPGVVLTGCAQALTRDGHTVVILRPPRNGTYQDHARVLLAAARTAGLGYLQHVVAITGAPHPQHTPGTRTAGARAAGTFEVSGRDHLDLLVLVLRPQAGGPSPAARGSHEH